MTATLRPKVLDRGNLDLLFEALHGEGYTTVGPTVRDGAIVYDIIAGSSDLPEGWTDTQEAASYRLRRRDDAALFGFSVGPQSWKQYLFPPRTDLFRVERADDGVKFVLPETAAPRYAFIGVRACEMAAIGIQDAVFLKSGFTDRTYAQRRTEAFIVAVQCSEAGGTCFCSSMGTGPACDSGFDLALTEMIDEERHSLLVEAGSERGAGILDDLPSREASDDDIAWAGAIVRSTAASMGRELDTNGIKELLYDNLEHARWDDVAERCLSCANCTLACPTCFCSTMEDATALSTDTAVRTRRWDSCFSLDFSALHRHPLRGSTRSQYRQWLTHKLASWIDQFGTSGCVGCGRCITWCPVGIDLTAEVAAIRAEPSEEVLA